MENLTSKKTGLFDGVSEKDNEKISIIIEEFCNFMGIPLGLNSLGYVMSVVACHNNGCPLDLDRMVEACHNKEAVSVVHDVSGINQHIDTSTGQLMRGFWPRYAKQQ